MAIREGRWDCVSCGRKANLGRDLRCGGCGRPRGKVKFYLPEDAAEVEDAALLATARAGADWICAYCEASNRAGNTACTGCGGARDEGAARVQGGGDATELTPEQEAARADAERRRLAERTRRARLARRSRLVVYGLFATMLFCGCGGFLTTGFAARWGGTKGHGGPRFRLGQPAAGPQVELLAKVATREIDVEAERLVNEAAWCDRVPAGGRVLRQTREQRGSRTVCRLDAPPSRPIVASATAPGLLLQDLGNGFFNDSGSSGGGGSSSSGGESSSCTSEPIYDDWCHYEILRWIVVRTPTTADRERTPDWPALALAPGEREGARRQRWEGTFLSSDGERVILHAANDPAFRSWRPGEHYAARWSFFGGLKAIDGPASPGDRP